MAISDEKAEAERTSREASKTSNDIENPNISYLPQSDEEYDVTSKTWCVVVVSSDQRDLVRNDSQYS
jgi:hypothetical protein